MGYICRIPPEHFGIEVLDCVEWREDLMENPILRTQWKQRRFHGRRMARLDEHCPVLSLFVLGFCDVSIMFANRDELNQFAVFGLYFATGQKGLCRSRPAYHSVSVNIMFCELYSSMYSLLPLWFLSQEYLCLYTCIIVAVNKILDPLSVSGTS